MTNKEILNAKKEEKTVYELLIPFLGPMLAKRCEEFSEVDGPDALEILAILEKEQENECFEEITQVVQMAMDLIEGDMQLAQNELQEAMRATVKVENYSRSIYNLVREITQHSDNECNAILITNIKMKATKNRRSSSQAVEKIEFLTFDKAGNLMKNRCSYESPNYIPMDKLVQAAVYYHSNEVETKAKQSNMVCLPDKLFQNHSNKELLDTIVSTETSDSESSKLISTEEDGAIKLGKKAIVLAASVAMTLCVASGGVGFFSGKAKYQISPEDQDSLNVLKTSKQAQDLVEDVKILRDFADQIGVEYNLVENTLKDKATQKTITLNQE